MDLQVLFIRVVRSSHFWAVEIRTALNWRNRWEEPRRIWNPFSEMIQILFICPASYTGRHSKLCSTLWKRYYKLVYHCQNLMLGTQSHFQIYSINSSLFFNNFGRLLSDIYHLSTAIFTWGTINEIITRVFILNWIVNFWPSYDILYFQKPNHPTSL